MLPDNNEYIDKRIWRWEGDAYVSDNSDTFVIDPYEGVWGKSKKKNISLVFSVSSQSGLFQLSSLVTQRKAWLVAVFNHITPAYAGSVSDDSSPMPMGVSDSGNSEKIFKKRSFLILMEGWEGTQALVQGDSHRSGKI